MNCKGKAPLDVAANDTITQLLRNEIIASSSSSSSTDDIRSPTSPESNVSEDDYKKLDKGNIGILFLLFFEYIAKNYALKNILVHAIC